MILSATNNSQFLNSYKVICNMEDSNNNNQGDLFTEIYNENVSSKGALGSVKRRVRGKNFSFEKFLFFLLFFLIIGVVCYVVGYRSGHVSKNVKDGENILADFVVIDKDSNMSSKSAIELTSSKLEASSSMSHRNDAKSKNVETIKIELPVPSKEDIKSSKDSSVSNAKLVVNKGNYTIQLVTYVNKVHAASEVKKLKAIHDAVFIIPSGKYYQVCIGREESFEKAKALISKLKIKKRYTDAYVRKIKK